MQNPIDNANANYATPLSLAQGPPSSVGSESVYKFPLISNACLNYSAGDSDSEVESISMKQAAKNTIIPPMAPPFALQSKSSPLSTSEITQSIGCRQRFTYINVSYTIIAQSKVQQYNTTNTFELFIPDK